MSPDYLSKHSSYLIKKIMEFATNAIFAIDIQGNFMFVNEVGARICDRPIEDIVGHPFSMLFSKETLPEVSVAFNKTAFYGEKIENHQTQILRPSGEVRDLKFSIAPLIDNGKIIGVVGTAEDITEQLKNQRAINAYTSMLTTVLNGLDAIVYAADMQTYEIVFANKNLKEFIGTEDLVGKICWQTLQKDQNGPCPFCTNPYLLDEEGRPKAESYSWEFQNTLTGRWLALNDKAIYWIDGRLVRIEVAIDTTRSKELHQEIISKGQKLSNIINTTAEGYWEIDNNNINIEVNDALCKMLGYSRQEIIGRSCYDFVDGQNAEILKEQEALMGLSKDRKFNIILKKSDGSDLHARIHATTIKDNNGNITGAFAFVTDITELLQIEGSVARYAAELERSNKELQDFAYIASHDLQEPLRKIVAFGDRLVERTSATLDEQSKDYLRRMQAAALRMQHFIEDLLQYSRIHTRPQPFAPVDLRVVIQEALIDLEECFRQSNAMLVMDELPIIEADPLQMRQLFSNLLSNAIKFRKKDIPPLINISYKSLDENSVELKVVDNGIGFDEQYKDKLFKPFSRLHGKSDYPGTGMGLAICDKIVKRHGGMISVNSEVGKGTTFTITLPQRQAQGGQDVL